VTTDVRQIRRLIRMSSAPLQHVNAESTTDIVFGSQGRYEY